MTDRLRQFLPTKRSFSPALVASIGFLLTIIALLANSPGWAIVIASLVLPSMALTELARRDVFESEPGWGAASVLAWGVLVGILSGILASAISAEWWVKGATLNVGAGGFGGNAADLAGTPGFGVLLLNGIVIPAVAVAMCTIGPFVLRRFPVFRNEVMDGVTLGFAAGCGLATGMAIVFVWPIVSGGSARGDSVADWTALLTGVLITRPIIFGLAVSFVCAGIWHSAISQKTVDLILPAAIGLAGAILFGFGDLLIQPSGTRKELLWHVLIAVALAVAGRFYVRRVLAQDRATQSAILNRVICPNCHASTPAGLFCASCGATLSPTTSIPEISNEAGRIAASEDPTEALPVISRETTSSA